MRDESAYTTDYSDLVDAFTQRFGERLKLLVLFGSQSRGEAHPGSDHDVFALIEDLPQDPLERRRAVMTPLLPVLFQLPERLSIIAKTPQEFSHRLTPLVVDVCMDGISLFGHEYFETVRRQVAQTLLDSGLHRRWIGGTWMWMFPSLPDKEWAVTWEGYREHI